MLHLRNVHKQYDRRDIIRVTELELDKGVYWFRGVNGSGKTTLLKIISALIPFSGDVVLNNRSIRKDAVEYRRLVSWAMAEPLFPEFLSGNDLVIFYCKVRKANRSEANEFITLFRMQDYINAPIGSYSSGMTKKLAIVLALIGKCPLIVLDEPFITLDKESVAIVCDLIEYWHRDHGISFLLSSHIDEDAYLNLSYTALTVDNHTVSFSA